MDFPDYITQGKSHTGYISNLFFKENLSERKK